MKCIDDEVTSSLRREFLSPFVVLSLQPAEDLGHRFRWQLKPRTNILHEGSEKLVHDDQH